MKNILKDNKGVNLISLAIAIVILVTVTTMLVYNAKDAVHIKSLTNMYNDIKTLREKISSYYNEYGAIPAKYRYQYSEKIQEFKNAGAIGANDDENEFYVIDLKAIENLTLNYGRDYEKVIENLDDESTYTKSLQDLYIINKKSHNIFYVKGITVNQDNNTITYYTDDDSVDVEKVQLTNVAIPGVIVEGRNKTYTDADGDTAVIPVGFAVVPGLNDVSEGLVISDVKNDTEDKGNQFVWIPVESAENYKTNTSYEDTNFSTNTKNDTGYLPDGIQVGEGQDFEVEKSLVINIGGFYISRYEAGDGSAEKERVEDSGTIGELVSKKDAYVYNWISQTNAKAKAKTFINNANVKSGLCTGIQWDMVMAFISSEPRLDGENQEYDVTKPSSSRHRHNSRLEQSGQNLADRVCNIYDLEGNDREYVAEKQSYNTSSPYVFRGGDYDWDGSASNRWSSSDRALRFYSFRFVLYVMSDEASVKPGEIADIIANPKEYYGRKVTNYKASDDDENTYRIFYVDKKGEFGVPNTIYLKADYSSSNYNFSNYSSYDVTNTKVREMNPAWAEQRGNNEDDWKTNEKVAEYVIGGPSIEMYVKSYNEAYTGETLENGTTIYALGANYSTTNSYGYEYTVNGDEQNNVFFTNIGTLDYTKFNSMYCGKNGSKIGYWWLASPSAYGDYRMCYVHCDHAALFSSNSTDLCAVSPLVSLKSNFIPQVEE